MPLKPVRSPEDSGPLTPREVREIREWMQERERKREDLRALWLAVLKQGTWAVVVALVGILLLGLKAWLDGHGGGGIKP